MRDRIITIVLYYLYQAGKISRFTALNMDGGDHMNTCGHRLALAFSESCGEALPHATLPRHVVSPDSICQHGEARSMPEGCSRWHEVITSDWLCGVLMSVR